MRHVRHEVLLHLIEFAETLRHRIEVSGEFGKLVTPIGGEPIPELTFRDAPCSLRELS